MNSFGTWDLVVLLVMLGVPLVATVTENSGRCDPRGAFVWWVVGLVIGCPALTLILGAVADANGRMIAFLASAAFAFVYQQALVRRARDAGQSKTLAYIAVIPVVSLGVMIYLLFKGTAPGAGAPQPA
jgi:uncharacterized membrane protein YhaH (DUF805 family)